MRNVNFFFNFRDSSYIASVHYCMQTNMHTIYFTNIALILEFGNCVQLFPDGTMKCLKKYPPTDFAQLQAALDRQLSLHPIVV